jgi:hypothetical protein
VTSEELVQQLLLDISGILDYVNEFREEVYELGYVQGLDEAIVHPEQYGLTRVDQ